VNPGGLFREFIAIPTVAHLGSDWYWPNFTVRAIPVGWATPEFQRQVTGTTRSYRRVLYRSSNQQTKGNSPPSGVSAVKEIDYLVRLNIGQGNGSGQAPAPRGA
jgi:hypothetical protein